MTFPPGYPTTVNEFWRHWFNALLRAALRSDPDEAVDVEVRELWAIRWPDGTTSGAMYGDAAESIIRTAAGGDVEIVRRTETISRTPWVAAPDEASTDA